MSGMAVGLAIMLLALHRWGEHKAHDLPTAMSALAGGGLILLGIASGT